MEEKNVSEKMLNCRFESHEDRKIARTLLELNSADSDTDGKFAKFKTENGEEIEVLAKRGCKSKVIRKKAGFCKFCGNQLYINFVECANMVIRIPEKCECVLEREKQRDGENIKLGRKMYRDHILKSTNLSKRQETMTFGNFEPDEKQKEAFNVAQKWAKRYIKNLENKESNEIGIFFTGTAGSGKTHLSTAILQELINRLNNTLSDKAAKKIQDNSTPLNASPYYFITHSEFLAKCRDFQNDSQWVLDRCKKARVLVLDDVGTEDKAFAKAKVLEVLDYRYNNMLPTIVTTNLAGQELATALDFRAMDRVKSNSILLGIATKSHRREFDLND